VAYENILREDREGVAFVTVNRPDKLNALNNSTIGELQHCFDALTLDESVRAVILTGSGEKAFVAGADISELAEQTAITARPLALRGQRLMNTVEGCTKPVVAAVNGYALGGGCELALACHIRTASDNAQFGLPEVTLGIIPGYGGTQRLARIAGPGVAREWVLTGEMIGAEEAWRVGVVNRLFAPEELKEGTWKLAETILSRGPIALRLALETIRRGLNMSQQEGEIIESDMFGLASTTDDMRQRMQAFLDKAKKK